MDDRLWTPLELARYFNVKVVTVYAAAADGRLPCIRVWEGRRRALIRFRREDIEQLIEDRMFPPKNDDTH